MYRHQEKLLSFLHFQYTPVYRMIIPILALLNVEQYVAICSNNVIHITFAAWKRDFCILIHTVRIQTTVSLYSSSLDSYRNRKSFYHVIIPSAQWSWRWVYWFHLVRPSVSALFSMLFSALWLGCGELWMRKYSPRYLRAMGEMRI